MPQIARRTVLAGAAALALRPARAAGRSLDLVLESEAVILDPYATTAAITRTFGYHVFDTLFATAENGEIRPQMVEAWEVSPDRLTWRFSLRDGLRWHDGAPVTSADCVASLRRWMPKDPLGRMLAAAVADLRATDPRSFTITLKEPFPLMLDVLGKPNAVVPFMLPERLANLPADKRITEIVGSGPFVFRPDLWRPGDRMTLDRNPAYVARAEPPDFLAGGKRPLVDSLVLRVMPDDATAANALVAGEVDYVQYVSFDQLERLARSRGVEVMSLGGIHMFQGNFRLNHASGPFADPAVRRVLWNLVDQAETLSAIGIPAEFGAPQCNSFWMCGSPLESKAGTSAVRFSIDAARRALAQTAYRGEKVIILETSASISETAARVLAGHMREAGFTVEEQPMDWGTVLARRAKKDGWSLFGVYSNGVDIVSPLNHFYVASSCADYPGWSCDSRIPALLTQFARAEGLEQRRAIADEIQGIAYELVPSVMWGQFARPAAYRTRLKALAKSSFPIFWGVEV
jgi:peptide/nickel transport system substrate-binding protein